MGNSFLFFASKFLMANSILNKFLLRFKCSTKIYQLLVKSKSMGIPKESEKFKAAVA